jgi:glyceraldehyde-3-phosphate dehydrogenase/erythrose-4-phosphate dehydrogenase
MRVGISGMGRIGRLALRAAMGAAERQGEDPRAGNRLEIVHLNEIKGGAPAIAHLLEFDSVQGRWRAPIRAEENAAIHIGERRMTYSEHAKPGDIPWGDLGVDVVLECTGKFLTPETLQGHLDRGAKLVELVVSLLLRRAAKQGKDASGDRSSTGRLEQNASSPSENADCVSSYISQPAATCCTQ